LPKRPQDALQRLDLDFTSNPDHNPARKANLDSPIDIRCRRLRRRL
jgi:predicted component of type VI protein secretion system